MIHKLIIKDIWARNINWWDAEIRIIWIIYTINY